MQKHNTFTKKLKKQFLSVNNSIENYFNKFNSRNFSIKNFTLSKNNRVFIIIGSVVILTLTYLSLPSFFNKDEIRSEIENQVLRKYNIKLKFNDQIKYGIFPKPHFTAKNLSIIGKEKEIASTNHFRIFIDIWKFFSINQIEIKDLVFNKTEFNIYKDDLVFFKELLKTEPNENKIIIKNSNIFFRNKEDEVLFINKIFDSKFFYDQTNLQNTLVSKNEIFNVPYKLNIKNDKFNKKNLFNFNSNKIRLNIDNVIDYDSSIKNGNLEILFINKDTSFDYEIRKNSLIFESENKRNNYKGKIDFKPFYLNANFNYEGLSTKNLFHENSIINDIIRAEVLNNKNLNAVINLKVKDITNIVELNKLNLITSIEEGIFNFSDSSIMWKDDLRIILNDSFLSFDENEINLIGSLKFIFNDIQNFYRFFQLQKDYRKDIKQIEIDFVFDLNQKQISFDNARIDNKSNSDLENFIENFNSKQKTIFNKVTFKNFVNNFFISYAG